MKSTKFIQKLVSEQKISLVASSKTISLSYSQKSNTSFQAANLLFTKKFFEEAITINYYAIYNKVLSLFFSVGIKCENHSGAIILLDTVFTIDTTMLQLAKQERIEKQYYISSEIIKNDVQNLLVKTQKYLEELDYFIETITTSKKEKFLLTFKKLYSL